MDSWSMSSIFILMHKWWTNVWIVGGVIGLVLVVGGAFGQEHGLVVVGCLLILACAQADTLWRER